MTSRPDPFVTNYELIRPFIDFNTYCQDGLDRTIAELIKIRASQINHCSACLVYHTRDARKMGESEERIYLLDGWREATHFTDRERAVLNWTELLTLVADAGAMDDAYAELENHFSEAEIIKITMLIGAINAFNRFNAGFARKGVATKRKVA